jgi:hypothetical protein
LQQAKKAAIKKQQRFRFKVLLRKRNSGDDVLKAEPEPKRARENSYPKISVPIITYKKGGAAELTTFLYDLNLRFAFAFTEFRTNSSKIVFASAYFKDNTKNQWVDHTSELADGFQSVTFDEIKQWLKDQISNPQTKDYHMARNLKKL